MGGTVQRGSRHFFQRQTCTWQDWIDDLPNWSDGELRAAFSQAYTAFNDANSMHALAEMNAISEVCKKTARANLL